MKPLKVLLLVLLALLLLVPAASAETYTLVDEDLVFGGGSGGIVDAYTYSYYNGEGKASGPITLVGSSYVLSTSYGDFSGSGVYISGSLDSSYTDDPYNPYSVDLTSDEFYYHVYFLVAGPGKFADFVAEVVSYAKTLSSANPDIPVILNIQCSSSPQVLTASVYIYPIPEISESAIQHVTVTYDDQSENYQVYVDTSDESVDVWVRGYVFGWLPVWTFGSNAFPPSTHFEWLTCPVRFLFWDVDWEVEVECNGESKFIYWSLDTPPIDGGTIPEPDPPFPDPDPGLPDDPDPFDPTIPFPTPSYNPSGLPNKIPTSLKEIIGFDLTEIKDRFKESIPFYSNAFDFVASAIEALFDFLFGLIAGTLGILIGFLSEPLTDIYNFIVWTSSVVFSFMDFLIIPNHIMSFLADFVPVEIVNLALAALGLDILLNVLSIAIPDLITAYKSTVRTYYHKVDHGIQKGGKK